MGVAKQSQRVKCRTLVEADVPQVLRLLAEGFPRRSYETFERGLQFIKTRHIPDGAERFGYCLVFDDSIVGVLLTLISERQRDDENMRLCNLTCWYVQPRFRSYASLLSAKAVTNRAYIYTNLSPSPLTWPIIERQGFRTFSEGVFVSFAALQKPCPSVVIEEFNEARHNEIEDYESLLRHQRMGCSVLVARTHDGLEGYIFRRFKIWSGRFSMPAMFTLYAPGRERLMALAGNFGRYFLPTFAPMLIVNANGAFAGKPGFYSSRYGRQFYKGERVPQLCDLRDTEFAIFAI